MREPTVLPESSFCAASHFPVDANIWQNGRSSRVWGIEIPSKSPTQKYTIVYFWVDLALRNPHQDHDPKREGQIHNMDFGITGVDLALEKNTSLCFTKESIWFSQGNNKKIYFPEKLQNVTSSGDIRLCLSKNPLTSPNRERAFYGFRAKNIFCSLLSE